MIHDLNLAPELQVMIPEIVSFLRGFITAFYSPRFVTLDADYYQEAATVTTEMVWW